MESISSDDGSERMMMNSKLRSPNQLGDSNTMDSFQDGGQQSMNPDLNDYPPPMDVSHSNPDMNSYPQAPAEPGMIPENYARMNEGMHPGQMAGYNAYNRGNYSMGDQHGGMSMAGSSEFPSQTSPYHGQFSQTGIRPGYPGGLKSGMSPARQAVGHSAMGMTTPGYNPASQRVMSGQSISQQQGGPTPTLNQLLQTPNSTQRYPPNSYGDYVGPQKGNTDVTGGNSQYMMQQSWGPNQRGINSFPQSAVASTSPYRNQGGSVVADMSQNRRSTGVPPNYPQGGGQYVNQQFSPNSQRYGMLPGQNRSGQIGMGSQAYGQMPPHYGQQGQVGYSQPVPPQTSQPHSYMQQPLPQQQPQPPGQPPGSTNPPSQSQPPPQPSPQPSMSPLHQSSPQHQSVSASQSSPQGIGPGWTQAGKKSGDEDEPAGDLVNSDELNENSTGSRGTPTSTGLHLGSGLPLRPTPSPPVGSTGSRSNTPASLTGNQAGSPMPPRPPSQQLDGQARMSQSPMATQGYNQQMMPPPVGPNQMGYVPGSNKMPGSSIGSSQMSPYPQYNSQYPGNFSGRQPGGPSGMPNASGMPNYPQQSMFNGPSPGSQMTVNPMYNNMSMNRSGMSPMNYNMYSGGQGSVMGANSQFVNYNNHMGQSSGSGLGPAPGPGSAPGPGPGPGSGTVTVQGPPGTTVGQTAGMGGHSGQTGSNNMGQPGMNNMSGMAQGQTGGSGTGAVKAAQAAAQAALIAAANSAANRSSNVRPPIITPPRMFGPQSMSHSNQMGQVNHMGFNANSTNNMPNSMNQLPNSHSPVPNAMGPMPNSGMPNSSMLNSSMPSNGPNSMQNTSSSVPNSVLNSMPNTMLSSSISSMPSIPSDGISNSRIPTSSVPSSSMAPAMPNSSTPKPGTPSMQDTSSPTRLPTSSTSDSRPPSAGNIPQCSSPSVSVSEGSVPSHSIKIEPPASTADTNKSGEESRATMTPPINYSRPVGSPGLMAGNHSSNASESGESAVCSSVSIVKEEPLPITTTPSSTVPMGESTTVVTQSITSPVTSVTSISETASNDSQLDIPPQPPCIPTPNCVPMPPIPIPMEEPPEKKVKKSSSKTSAGDFSRMFEMGHEMDRRPFLDKLAYFLDQMGTPISAMPAISKQPLDLYKLFHEVRERGGMVEVTKAKKWKEICGAVNIGSSASAAFTLKKNYIKYLFAYECRFERGGIDPQPILAHMEAQLQQKREQKNRRAPSPAGSQGSQEAFRPPSTPNSNSQGVDPFSPAITPNAYMQNAESGMGPMGSGMMPPNSMMNNMQQPNGMMSQNSMGAGGPGMMHPQMQGPNSMMGGSMPPGSMMAGNSYMMAGGPGGMMPNNMGPPSNVPSQNSMMSNNMGQSNTSMMTGNNMPNNSESVRCADPFADEPSSTNYPRQSGNSQMPAFSSMQPQSTMTNSAYNYSNRPNMPQNMPPNYSNINQSNVNTYGSEGGMSRIPSAQGEQFSDSYRRPPDGNFTPNPNNSNRPMDPFNSSQYSAPVNQSTSGRQFPFGDQFNRADSRFGNQQAPPSSQSSQQFRPSSQQSGMIPQQPNPDQNFPARYGNQQMPVQQPPQPVAGPQDQYTSQNYPNQSAGYPSKSGMNQDQFSQGYSTGQQGPSYPGQRPSMTQEMSAGIYGTPNKRYSDMERREGYMTPDSRRDTGQWSPMQQRYPQHSGPGYMNTSPGGPNMPPMSYGSRSMAQRMSPTRDPKGPYSPKKPGGMVPNAQFPPKKEINFPHDSVESVQPLLNKRRRLNKNDLGQIEAWRLMLALKSGLLAETTWALDTLNILLYDDATITYFNLSHLPGLLEVLLEHFRRSLIDMFGVFQEMEISSGDLDSTAEQFVKDDCSIVVKENMEELPAVNGGSENENKVLPDYTMITRQGKPVKMEEDSEDAGLLDFKDWDVYTGFVNHPDRWQRGQGDMTAHIITHFERTDKTEVFRRLFFTKRRKVTRRVSESDEVVEQVKEDNGSLDQSMEVENVQESEQELEKSEIKSDDKVSEKSESTASSGSDDIKDHTCNNFMRGVNIKTEPRDPELDKTDSLDSPPVIKLDIKKETPNSAENIENSTEENLNKSEVTENCNETEDMGACKEAAEKEIVSTELLTEAQLKLMKKCESDLEDEAYCRDQPALRLTSDGRDEIGKRCICISNIFRSLSCVPGNDLEFSKHPGLMTILGKLLLLHHQHLPRTKVRKKFDRDESELEDLMDTSLGENENEWWWDYLDALRENTLVIFANICGQLDLSMYSEKICLPILDGLLHWAVCPAACATDPLPTMSSSSVLSPQRLVLEALCKLCIHEVNVDLLLATPPFERIVQLFGILTKFLANRSEQVTMEFAIVLLSELVQGDSSASRAVALQHPCISLLIDFLETAEQKALQVANMHGINMLRESPEMMGTSLDMLRRAATILLCLAQVPENRTLFVHHQSRLLSLVMSQILDQLVAQILSDVLFQCSHSLS